jgi:4-alpha-glucanotransferase
MSWAGGLRVDHVMGLERQFWVPRGYPGRDGGYVAFRFDELSSVLAQESVRHGCLVVGEDLGTVPAGFRERLAHAQILSTRVLYFERESDGRYRSPDAYPLLSVAHAGTHDLPPIEGYLAGGDIDARKRAGLYRRREDEDAARAARNDDMARLFDALAPVNGGVIATPANARDAIHRFLAKSGSGLALIQIEDAVGQTDQANLPGTIDEYPNWRRKYAFSVDGLSQRDEFKHLADLMAERALR